MANPFARRLPGARTLAAGSLAAFSGGRARRADRVPWRGITALLRVTHGALFLAPAILLAAAFWTAWWAGPVAVFLSRVPERTAEPEPEPGVQRIQPESVEARIVGRTAGVTTGFVATAPQAPNLSFLPESIRPDLDLVRIPEGSFLMGSPEGIGYDSERPRIRFRSLPSSACAIR